MELKELIDKIDSLKQELDSLRPIDSETEQRIMQKFRLDWNYHSNSLEGNSLTFGETKSFLLHGITANGKPLKDHLEIEGHNEAILLLDEIIKEKRPITESFIRELNLMILKKPYEKDALTPDGKPTKKLIQPGKYKTDPNHVKTATGEIFYFATPQETPSKMMDLLNWYNAENSKKELHPVLLASLFHYKMILIHPFDDGNGRVTRILMNLILMSHGFPPTIIKTNDKGNYFIALRQADGGNTEPFIVYIGEQLVNSLELMIKGVKGLDLENSEIEKQIEDLKRKLKK